MGGTLNDLVDDVRCFRQRPPSLSLSKQGSVVLLEGVLPVEAGTRIAYIAAEMLGARMSDLRIQGDGQGRLVFGTADALELRRLQQESQ